jgi:hypothetical protein
MATKTARILVASARHAYTRLFAILPGHDLIFVSTCAEARRALNEGLFDLIMLGVHFDESRMFEILQCVKADERHDHVPVMCFRGVVLEDAESKLWEAAAQPACEAMGAVFFDLAAFPDDSVGNAAARRLVEGMLTGA